MGVVRLSDITGFDVFKYGGKGASLAKMINAGIPVPDGFVVGAANYKNMTDELEKAILGAFDELGAEFVAVRSSATAEDGNTAAWAGQLETFLNTTKDSLIANIEACWASLQNDRAKAYADENGVDLASQKVAVVVQAMVQSDVSGVAFSAHPVTQSVDHVVIEAAYGLGEAVVSGQVTPDTYVVSKAGPSIDEKYVATQTRKLEKAGESTGWQDVLEGDAQKISDEQTIELTKMVIKLENYFGAPVDVEWLFKDGTLYITQSRPITTLGENV